MSTCVRVAHVLISLIAPHASSSSPWTHIGGDEPRAIDNGYRSRFAIRCVPNVEPVVDFTYQRWEIRFADQRLTPSNIDEISTKHPVEESLLIEDTQEGNNYEIEYFLLNL